MNADTFKEPDVFKSSIKLSLIAHGVIVVVFGIKAYFFTAEPIDFSAAVRVDIVALPDKLDPSKVTLGKKEEEKKVEAPSPKPTPELVKETALPKKTPEADAINLKKTKNKQSEALEKLKRQAALDKIKNQVEEGKKGATPSKQVITEVKGNVISPGTALTGLNKLQHESYISDLDRHIKQNWALPEWLAKRALKARIRVRLDNEGKIISREIISSSGDNNYDDIVVDTIDRSAPFPAPPEKFVAIVSVQGIVIGFPE